MVKDKIFSSPWSWIRKGFLVSLSLFSIAECFTCFTLCNMARKINKMHLEWKRSNIFLIQRWHYHLYQGPQSLDQYVHGLLGSGLHSSKWVEGEQAKLHLCLQLLLIIHITAWALPPVRSAEELGSQMRVISTENCTCKGSRLHTLYENYSEIILPSHCPVDKFSSTKPFPGAKKVWDCWFM